MFVLVRNVFAFSKGLPLIFRLNAVGWGRSWPEFEKVCLDLAEIWINGQAEFGQHRAKLGQHRKSPARRSRARLARVSWVPLVGAHVATFRLMHHPLMQLRPVDAVAFHAEV